MTFGTEYDTIPLGNSPESCKGTPDGENSSKSNGMNTRPRPSGLRRQAMSEGRSWVGRPTCKPTGFSRGYLTLSPFVCFTKNRKAPPAGGRGRVAMSCRSMPCLARPRITLPAVPGQAMSCLATPYHACHAQHHRTLPCLATHCLPDIALLYRSQTCQTCLAIVSPAMPRLARPCPAKPAMPCPAKPRPAMPCRSKPGLT